MYDASFLLSFAITFSILLFPPVHPIEESFCFGVGYNDKNVEGLGLISMGATTWYNHPLNIFWGANHPPKDLSLAPDKFSIMRVKGQAADGKMEELNGWLQIQIQVKHTIGAIAVWAITDKMETFGKFVSVPTSSCNGVESGWGHEGIVPCSATPADAAFNPNMYIWNTFKSSTAPTFIYLLWKADTTFCNMPQSIKFILALTPKAWTDTTTPVAPFFVRDGAKNKLGPLLFQSYELEPAFYGAASPLFDRNKLRCRSPQDDVSASKPVTWLKRNPSPPVFDGLDQKYYDDRWKSDGSENLAVAASRSVCKAKEKGFIDFGGRCSGKNVDAVNAGRRLYADIESPPVCLNYPGVITDQDVMDKFEHVGTVPVHVMDYMTGQRKDEVHKKPCDCPPIPTCKDVQATASSRIYISWIDSNPYEEPERGCKEYSGKPEYHMHGLCLISEAGQYALGVRQWHTIANLFICMVIIPVSCFLARYLKGAIPIVHETRVPFIPLKIWYICHVFLVVPVICLYGSGIAAIRRQFAILGGSRNEYAAFHRVCGIIIMVVFGCQCIFGFLRPIHMFYRKISIYVHWGCGYFVYYFGAIASILSYRIPASPFSFRKVLDPEFSIVYYHFAPLMVMIWLVLDVVVHIGVTMYIKSYDKEQLMERRSSYFPLILPMRVDSYYLRTHDYDEMPYEDRCLTKASLFYIAFCLSFFVFTLITMTYLNFEVNHGYGPMDCTHSSNNMFTAGDGDISDEELKAQTNFCYE